MIGTAAAIIGSAVIAGGASAIASGNNSKAIDKSTQAQTQSNAESLALQRDVYSQNRTALQPWQEGGLSAFNMNNAMLGITPTVQPQQMQPNALSQFYPMGGRMGGRMGGGMEDFAYGGAFGEGGGYRLPGSITGYGGGTWDTGGNPVTVGMGGTPAPQGNPWDGFKNWLAGSDYAFQANRGEGRVNGGFASGGVFQSGARDRALAEFNTGLNAGYRSEYQDRVTGQQQIGLGAASAQAGVGQTFANNATSLNSANANALSQAAIARANNSNGLVNSLGSIFSGTIGRL